MTLNVIHLVSSLSNTKKRKRDSSTPVLVVGPAATCGTRVGCGVQRVIRMWDTVARELTIPSAELLFRPFMVRDADSGL